MTRPKRKQFYQQAHDTLERMYDASALQTDAARSKLLDTIQATVPEIDLSLGWLQRTLSQIAREQPDRIAVKRSEKEWQTLFPRYPIDGDGFAHAFASHDHQNYLPALEKFGIVVIRVWDDATCAATIDAMFEELNAQVTETGRTPQLCPNNPATWHNTMWPKPTSRFLIDKPAFHPQAFRNRVCPTLTQVFTHIWQEHRLRVTIDNWGVVRGVRQIPTLQADGSLQHEDKPRWGRAIKPHWDYNPWLFVEENTHHQNPGYQALIALNDQPLESGCHLTLPGGVRFLEQWCRERVCPEHLGNKRRSHRPSLDDPIRNFMQPIPLKRGTCVIWSWGQLHGSINNTSQHLRLHQYIRMFPAREVQPFYETHDRYAPARMRQRWDGQIPQDALPTNPQSRKLLGLDTW